MRFFIALLLVCPLMVPAQKLKSTGYTKSGQKVIETYAVSVKEARAQLTSLRLKAIGPVYYIYVAGYGLGTSNISPQDQVSFLFDNDSSITVTSNVRQSFWINDSGRNMYQHRYTITRKDVEDLSRYNLKALRKSAGDDYTYLSIPARFQGRAKRLSKFFIKYLPKKLLPLEVKEKVAVETPETKVTEVAPGAIIRIEDITQHIGDSVTICAKVFTSRYLSGSKSKPTLLNLGAAYPNQPLTVVIYEEDRAKFGAPEEAFKDKEICVSGVVQLFNEKPQMVVHAKEQITVKQ